jgi:hypothetical protein
MVTAQGHDGRRRWVNLAILIGLSLCNAACVLPTPVPGVVVAGVTPGNIPKISLDIVDENGQPLDGVTVLVERHSPGAVAIWWPGSSEISGTIDSDPPRIVNQHFEYECPWGSKWVQLRFTKNGYLSASCDVTAASKWAPSRVVLYSRP